MSNLFKLKNPIQRTVVDEEQLTELFRRYNIIPYYGAEAFTSHATLDLFQHLTALSGGFTSAINDISQYSFGRHLTVAPRMIGGIFVDESERETLTFDQQLSYSNELMQLGIPLANVSGWSRKILRYLKDSGNAYLHLKRVTIGDTTQYFIQVLHYRQVAYLRSKDAGEQFLIYTKIWDETYWAKGNPPLIVRATKMNMPIKWDKTQPNTEEAIIHLQTDTDNDPSDFYSRPEIIAILSWLYTDIELGTLNGKIAATELISKKLLAFQAPDPNTYDLEDEERLEHIDVASETTSINGTLATSGVVVKGKKVDYFKANMLRLKELTTNLGGYKNVSSFAGVEYPFGQEPPTVIDLEVNRDTNHHKWQCDTAVSMICSNLQWDASLTGLKSITTSIGGNIIKDLFVMRNETTIIPTQENMSTIWNNVFSQILRDENAPSEMLLWGIQFPDIISRLVEKLSKGNSSVSITENIGEPSEPTTNEPE